MKQATLIVIFCLSSLVPLYFGYQNPKAFESIIDAGVNIAAISSAVVIGVMIFFSTPDKSCEIHSNDTSENLRIENIVKRRRLALLDAVKIQLVSLLLASIFCFYFKWVYNYLGPGASASSIFVKMLSGFTASSLCLTLSLTVRVPFIVVLFLNDTSINQK